MNAKAGIGIVAALVVIGGGAYFLMHSSNSQTAMQGEATTTGASTTGSEMSLKELLGMGSSKTCTFNDSMDGNPVSGTVYVASGKVRGDFSATVNGAAMGTHMMSDGTTMYLWMDGMTTGFKTSMTAAATTTASHGFDADKKINYQCASWTPDSSKFVVPSSVTFSDMSAMMHGGASAGASASVSTQLSAQCGRCDQLSGNQKAACRAALKCQ